jgi:hypothetical protein
MTSAWQRIAIVVPSYGSRTHDGEGLRRDLAAVFSSAVIEIVASDFQSLPGADLLIASSDVARAMEPIPVGSSRKRTVSWSDNGEWRSVEFTGRLDVDNAHCRRIVLYDASYHEAMKFLDTYQFAAAITRPFGERRLDGLAEVGRMIGAREVESASRIAWASKSYTTLEHDECATSGELLARYLQAYDPDLPR